MNILSSVVFVCIGSFVYTRTRNMLGALLGMGLSVVMMTAVMIGANLLITPFYMGVTVDEVKALIDKAYRHCEEILKRDEEKLKQVVEFLLENETMSGPQFAQCMRGEEIQESSETSLFDAYETDKE